MATMTSGGPGRFARLAHASGVGALVVLSFVVLFWRLDGYSLVNGDEAFYHYVARHMVESGNWFRLEFTGQHRLYDTFVNAPWQYWARALLIRLVGDNLWSVRLLSATCGALAVFATYRLGTLIGGRPVGLLAGAMLLTAVQFVHLHGARTGELETAVAWLLTESAIALYLAATARRPLWHYGAWLVALANVKAPLLAVALLGGALFLGTGGRRRQFPPGRLAAGLAATLAVALSWHLLNAWVYRDGLGGVFAQMLQRGSGPGAGPGVAANLVYYARAVAFGTFPQVVFWAIGLSLLWRRRADAGGRDAAALLLVFPLAVVGFFLVVQTRNPWYLTPAYPFLCVLGAWWLRDVARGDRPALDAWLGVLALGALLTGSVAIADFNPFAGRAVAATDGLTWRLPPGAWGAIGLGGLALLIGGLALKPAAFRAPLVRATFVASLVGLALGIGAARVLAPLRHLPYVSGTALLADHLRQARAAGVPVRMPVPVFEPGPLRIRYYFGDLYDITLFGLDGRSWNGFPRVYALLTPRPDGSNGTR